MTSSLESRDELIEAILSLRAEVQALGEVMPGANKTSPSRRSLVRSAVFAICIVIASQLFSTSIISACFLAQPGDRPAACSVMPGYVDSQARRSADARTIEELLRLAEENQKILVATEEELSSLEEQVRQSRQD